MSYYPAAKIINDTDAHTGRFGCVQAIKDSEIATLVAENITGDLTSIDLKSNTVKLKVLLLASHLQVELLLLI